MSDYRDSANDNRFVWSGVLDPTMLRDDVVSAGHRLANAAKAGDWSTVFQVLDDPAQHVNINGWRPGGTAWFSVLHQAAWHGAPADVVDELIRRGALRSLTDAWERTPYDVRIDQENAATSPKGAALKHKSVVLRERHLKAPTSPLPPELIMRLDRHLGEVIDGRIGRLYDGRKTRHILRYPPVGILHEVPGQHVWFPVPGMYGGFDITLRGEFLDVQSWCRIVGGSGQAHVITRAGAILVDEGFV